MTTRMEISVVALAVLLLGSSLTWASEPNDSSISLQFEVKSTAMGPFSARQVQVNEAFGPWRPTYAAGVPMKGPGRYLPIIGLPGASGFLRFALGYQGLSATQKQFLQATEGLLNAHRQGGPVPQWRGEEDGADSSRQLLLYAMTLDDAKAMAEAYVEFVMAKWRRDADGHEGNIRDLGAAISAGEERMRELEKIIGNAEQTLNSLKQRLPYRTEKEAMEAIAELDRMLNAAQVDIAGIQSKIKAIQDHLRSGKSPYDEAIKAKLQVMFVEESIALQGAEARKKMATQLRTEANRFLDVQQSLANARIETEELQKKNAGSREELEKTQYRLEMVMADKPQVADQAVAIYPVQWTPEGRDN